MDQVRGQNPRVRCFHYFEIADRSTSCCCCSMAKFCPTLCDPMDCSTPDFPVLYHPLEFVQTHIQWCHPTISSSVTSFSSCCQSWHIIIKKTLNRALEWESPSLTAKLWARDTKEGTGCAGTCQSSLLLALNSHKAEMSSGERARRNQRAMPSFYSEGKVFWNCQREGPALGLSLFHNKIVWAKSVSPWHSSTELTRGGSDLDLQCFAHDKDFTSCMGRCCGIQLWLSG